MLPSMLLSNQIPLWRVPCSSVSKSGITNQMWTQVRKWTLGSTGEWYFVMLESIAFLLKEGFSKLMHRFWSYWSSLMLESCQHSAAVSVSNIGWGSTTYLPGTQTTTRTDSVGILGSKWYQTWANVCGGGGPTQPDRSPGSHMFLRKWCVCVCACSLLHMHA